MKREAIVQFAVCFGLILLLLATAGSASAYEVVTHQAISETASTRSTADDVLKTALGRPDGLDTKIGGFSLLRWVREGATREDEFPRFLNHFHNPLADSWLTAGFGIGQSAILWGQNREQSFPSWSWRDTRDSFHDALTKPKKKDRDLALARTFEGLGRLIHLVQDMASPAHTRNDAHKWYNYEKLVEDVQSDPEERATFAGWLSRQYADPDRGWKTFDPNQLAPIPIARLFDTDRYDGSNPSITTEALMGLAEYVNANFLSEDSLFSPSRPNRQPFPYPRRSSTREADYQIILRDGSNVTRRYFRKDFDGDNGYRLATVGVLRDYIQRFNLDVDRLDRSGLDESVYRDYAERLMPRAVAYSAALLDYFFRGSLTVERVSWDEDGVFIVVENNTDEEMEGRFELWAIHGRDTDAEERVRLVDLNGGQVTRLSRFGGRQFQLSVPADARPTADYVLIFRGRLGDEQDAVVGRVFTVPHALVIQQDYRADLTGVCGRSGQSFLPSPPDYTREFASDGCDWRATNHTLSGQILTNSQRPILQRIEARWFGRFPGRAPLTLAGRTYAAGVWEREGTEPDPTTFSIADPAWRDGAILLLMIEFVGGKPLETSLAAFGRNRSSHQKQIIVHDPGPDDDRRFLVTSARSVSLSLTYNFAIDGDARRPLFRASSISGRTSPTDTRTFRKFASFGFSEGVLVTPTMFSESVIDDFLLLPPGTTEQGTREPFLAIEPLLDPQTSQGPFITWQADVERVYQPREIEFLRAFMTASPPPYSIPLRGTQR